MTKLTGIAGNVVDGMVTGKFLGENAMAAFGFSNTVMFDIDTKIVARVDSANDLIIYRDCTPLERATKLKI